VQGGFGAGRIRGIPSTGHGKAVHTSYRRTVEPIQRTFTRGQSILEVQKTLASYVGR